MLWPVITRAFLLGKVALMLSFQSASFIILLQERGGAKPSKNCIEYLDQEGECWSMFGHLNKNRERFVTGGGSKVCTAFGVIMICGTYKLIPCTRRKVF